MPLGAVLRDAVRDELKSLGIAMTIVEKDVGYELRCAAPTAFDLDYTRDLGAGAVRTLLAGASGVMITRQGGAIVPVPFEQIMDPNVMSVQKQGADDRESVTAVDDLTVKYVVKDWPWHSRCTPFQPR